HRAHRGAELVGAEPGAPGLRVRLRHAGILPMHVVEMPPGGERRGDPMPTEAAVLEALRPVEDPELHQSIVDLDMVKEVAIDGGRVAVTVALTVAGCPLKPEITRRVSEAVQPLDGVESVDVDLTVMEDEQRQAIAERLRQQHAGAADDGRPGRVNPFTDARTRVLAVA